MSDQDQQAVPALRRCPRPVFRVMGRPGPDDRPSLPPGHPSSWGAINKGTVLAGEAYPADVLGRRGTLT